jgi:hypothetical protein
MKKLLLVAALFIACAARAQGPIQQFWMLNQSAAGGFDTDAEAFFTRVASAGGTLSTTEKNAWNAFVISAKAHGYYSKFSAAYPFIGASATSCSINAISSSYTITWFNSPTFSSTGVDFNGTNQYGNTGFDMSLLANESTHISAYSRQNQTDDGALMGVEGAVVVRFIPNHNSSIFQFCEIGLTPTQTGAPMNRQAYFIGSHTAGATNLYRNAVNVFTLSAGSPGANPSLEMYVGNENQNGTARSDTWSLQELAFVSMGSGLTALEIADLNTDIEAFQDALSRGIQ